MVTIIVTSKSPWFSKVYLGLAKVFPDFRPVSPVSPRVSRPGSELSWMLAAASSTWPWPRMTLVMKAAVDGITDQFLDRSHMYIYMCVSIYLSIYLSIYTRQLLLPSNGSHLDPKGKLNLWVNYNNLTATYLG